MEELEVVSDVDSEEDCVVELVVPLSVELSQATRAKQSTAASKPAISLLVNMFFSFLHG